MEGKHQIMSSALHMHVHACLPLFSPCPPPNQWVAATYMSLSLSQLEVDLALTEALCVDCLSGAVCYF